MKVLLVYPEFPDTYWSFRYALKFEGKGAPFPPLGLLTVSAMLPDAWERSYSPGRNAAAVGAIGGHDLQYRLGMLVARLFFRGIYFPQMTRRAWLRLLYENRRTITSLTREGFSKWRASRRRSADVSSAVTAPAAGSGD